MAEIELTWPTPPTELSLGPAEVHVWAVLLEASPENLSGLALTLSSDERTRAERFRLPLLRARYTVGRASLRLLLGRYLGLPPADLQFRYSSRGKPALPEPDPTLHFNLAHSDALALIAVTRESPLGVDVERIRPMRDAEQIAGRFFSAREAAEFQTIPTEQRDAGFFNLWTRKEAWLKATGAGISDSLARFEVTFLPTDPPGVRAIDGQAAAGAAWSLSVLSPARGFVGALAIPTPPPRLKCWRMTAGVDQLPGSFSR